MDFQEITIFDDVIWKVVFFLKNAFVVAWYWPNRILSAILRLKLLLLLTNFNSSGVFFIEKDQCNWFYQALFFLNGCFNFTELFLKFFS